MSEPETRLLSDLARLATRYEPKDWAKLVEWLDDRRKRAQLRRLLIELAETSRATKRPARRAPGRAAGIHETIQTIRARDPETAAILEDIWRKLRSKELLPTLATVRAFSDAMGMKRLESNRREQAVTELMERLVDLPPDIVEERMRRTVVEDRELGQEYERWVHLILRDSRDESA